jgi:error-prone DNA polymerase
VLAFPTTTAPALPGLTEQERAALDYRITGIPTGPQVMRFYRERLVARGVRSSADIQRGTHGTTVTVAGAMVVKQHPETAKGHVFLSLEDEYGLVNIIIRPATYAKYKPVVDLGGAVVVEGTLQHVDGVVSVMARRLDELALFVKLASRDWQ